MNLCSYRYWYATLQRTKNGLLIRGVINISLAETIVLGEYDVHFWKLQKSETNKQNKTASWQSLSLFPVQMRAVPLEWTAKQIPSIFAQEGKNILYY